MGNPSDEVRPASSAPFGLPRFRSPHVLVHAVFTRQTASARSASSASGALASRSTSTTGTSRTGSRSWSGTSATARASSGTASGSGSASTSYVVLDPARCLPSTALRQSDPRSSRSLGWRSTPSSVVSSPLPLELSLVWSGLPYRDRKGERETRARLDFWRESSI